MGPGKTDCPNCNHNLEATLFLAAYDEMKSQEITEGAYITADIVCENCLAEFHVQMEMDIRLVDTDFVRKQGGD